MNRSFVIAVMMVALGGVSVGAQQPEQQPQPTAQAGDFVLKVNSQIVVLDTVVTDKSGNTVDNLNREDFSVFEDKRPQTIRNFDRPQVHALPGNVPIGSTAELDAKAPEAPVSIIVLDEVSTKFEDEAFARYSLQKYLKTQSDTLPQPTMLVAVTLHHFTVLRDYTTSRKEILGALDRHFASYPWHLGGSWDSEQISQVFSTLRQVAQATVGHRGHKNVIWIGRGLPSIRMENLLQVDQEALENAIESCTNMLRDARITLYTVDPAGVASAPSSDQNGSLNDDPFGADINFNALAAATGGRAFFGRNDVDNLIGKSVRDGNEFYTIAYRPTQPSDDIQKFRNIHIVMKNPSLTATTRQGYYLQTPQGAGVTSEPAAAKTASEVAAAEKESERLQGIDLLAAAGSMLVYDGLPITVTRSATNPDDFTLHVAAASLMPSAGDAPVEDVKLAFLVASFDRKGKLLHQEAHVLAISLKKVVLANNSASHTLDFQTRIATAAPAARVRFVVRMVATAKLGADNFLLVDKKMLSDPNERTTQSKRRN